MVWFPRKSGNISSIWISVTQEARYCSSALSGGLSLVQITLTDSRFQKHSKVILLGAVISIMTLLVLVRDCTVVSGAGLESKYPSFDSTAVSPSPLIVCLQQCPNSDLHPLEEKCQTTCLRLVGALRGDSGV